MSPVSDSVERTIIADSSTLIALAAANRFAVLQRLYGRIIVTRAVLEEVMAGGAKPGARELARALREGWIRGAPTPSGTWTWPELGTGEASCIALALTYDDALVLMDDLPGRACAAARGVATLDTSGVLNAAREVGLE